MIGYGKVTHISVKTAQIFLIHPRNSDLDLIISYNIFFILSYYITVFHGGLNIPNR